MASIIQDGPNRGFYTIPDTLSNETGPTRGYDASFGQPDLYQAMRAQQLAIENTAGTGQNVYYRYSPGPGRDVSKTVNNRPPFIDGFYYIRRNDAVDLRQQLYALETDRVPSTGNTEVFNTSLEAIRPPSDYCPYYIDPCVSDWCAGCLSNRRQQIATRSTTSGIVGVVKVVEKWMILFVFVMVLAGLLIFVVV